MSLSKTIYMVQHADTVAGPKHFSHLVKHELKIRSHFPTLQGEGPWAGQYVYFWRFAGCNYGDKTTHCQFCDTDFRMDNGEIWDFDAMREQWLLHGCDHVVITGGEPTLQKNVVGLCFNNPDTQFQFETNGSQKTVLHELLELPNVTIVCSPKWSNTGNIIVPSEEMLAKATFKFLVSADPMEYDHDLPSWYRRISQPFYLSPIAVYNEAYEGEVVSAWGGRVINHELTAKNYAYAAERAIALNRKGGLRAMLSIQQHIFTNIP